MFSFWCLYMLALVAARNSVTLRMMDEIDRANSLTTDGLNSIVPDEKNVAVRIAAMEAGGLFDRDPNGGIKVTSKGVLIGRIAIFLQRLFSIKISG